jgi:hypothetical protein
LENDFYKHQIGSKRGGGGGEEEESEGKEKERTEQEWLLTFTSILSDLQRSPNKVSVLSPVSFFERCEEQTYLRRYS